MTFLKQKLLTTLNLTLQYHIQQRLKEAIESMKKGLPTVPSTLRDELSYNVFLRAAELPQDNPHRKENAISTLAHLRSLKDKYSPPKI